ATTANGNRAGNCNAAKTTVRTLIFRFRPNINSQIFAGPATGGHAANSMYPKSALFPTPARHVPPTQAPYWGGPAGTTPNKPKRSQGSSANNETSARTTMNSRHYLPDWPNWSRGSTNGTPTSTRPSASARQRALPASSTSSSSSYAKPELTSRHGGHHNAKRKRGGPRRTHHDAA